jgi:hypothetical protein
MGAIVIRTRYDEGTESAEVATSVDLVMNISAKFGSNLFVVSEKKMKM